jgi:hypothetical protein
MTGTSINSTNSITGETTNIGNLSVGNAGPAAGTPDPDAETPDSDAKKTAAK